MSLQDCFFPLFVVRKIIGHRWLLKLQWRRIVRCIQPWQITLHCRLCCLLEFSNDAEYDDVYDVLIGALMTLHNELGAVGKEYMLAAIIVAMILGVFGKSDGCRNVEVYHYCDVIMVTMASQITSLTIVYSTIYSGADQRKHQSSASLAFVRGPVISPHKGPVTRKMFPFDDVIMSHRQQRPLDRHRQDIDLKSKCRIDI